jgi:hypothetical protein
MPVGVVGARTPQHLHELVIDLHASGRDHQVAMLFGHVGGAYRLDPQSRPHDNDLGRTRSQPDLVAKWLWDHHTSCLVNGNSHAIRLRLSYAVLLSRHLCEWCAMPLAGVDSGKVSTRPAASGVGFYWP